MKRKRRNGQEEVLKVFIEKSDTKQHIKQEAGETEEQVTTNEGQESVYRGGGEQQLSEYEKKRLENIKKNEEMLMLLNFEKELKILKDTNRRKSTDIGFTPRVKKAKVLEPIRRSLRISGKSPEQKPSYTDVKIDFAMAATPVLWTRKPSGPIDIAPVNDIKQTESQTFLNALGARSCNSHDSNQCKSEMISSTDSYKEEISKLNVLPKNVAKIVPQRISSMAIHPSSTKPVICAGDKWGNIGFWDVEAKREGNNGIYVYEPHSQAVTSLNFHPAENNLYSTSYDGTVRCADFNTCVFDEVYSTDDGRITGLSFQHSSLKTLVLCDSDGQVAVIDTRARKSTSLLYDCHSRAVKCVHCSPTNSNLFCTSSADGSIALWDIRSITGMRSKLDSAHFSRSVNSAFFSPVSGNQILTTSFDDYVKIFGITPSLNLESKRTIKHFNQTGRWLTPFKAVWDPKNDSGFVVGSMHPGQRKVEIYHSEQKGNSPLVELYDENYTTITSINVFHNTRNILASGNSSGKVFIWTEKRN